MRRPILVDAAVQLVQVGVEVDDGRPVRRRLRDDRRHRVRVEVRQREDSARHQSSLQGTSDKAWSLDLWDFMQCLEAKTSSGLFSSNHTTLLVFLPLSELCRENCRVTSRATFRYFENRLQKCCVLVFRSHKCCNGFYSEGVVITVVTVIVYFSMYLALAQSRFITSTLNKHLKPQNVFRVRSTAYHRVSHQYHRLGWIGCCFVQLEDLLDAVVREL